ncbi:hypothetical protein [Exiguobacterium antarcticum]|nr:hypothetical protein [Exiguobacterium antarcticum]
MIGGIIGALLIALIAWPFVRGRDDKCTGLDRDAGTSGDECDGIGK